MTRAASDGPVNIQSMKLHLRQTSRGLQPHFATIQSMNGTASKTNAEVSARCCHLREKCAGASKGRGKLITHATRQVSAFESLQHYWTNHRAFLLRRMRTGTCFVNCFCLDCRRQLRFTWPSTTQTYSSSINGLQKGSRALMNRACRWRGPQSRQTLSRLSP
jgi:hypothetical protein